jgi:hypothetical protein
VHEETHFAKRKTSQPASLFLHGVNLDLVL